MEAAVAQEVEQLSAGEKIGGSIPGFPNPHAEVSLGKTLNPTISPNALISV